MGCGEARPAGELRPLVSKDRELHPQFTKDPRDGNLRGRSSLCPRRVSSVFTQARAGLPGSKTLRGSQQ